VEVKLYEGKMAVKFPEDLFDRLEKYFLGEGFPPAKEIRKAPLDKYGKREGTSLAKLNNALKEIGYTKYRYSNIIGRELWGWKLRDLSSYYGELYPNFTKNQKAYDSLSNKGRSSNIPSQVRLYHELRLLKLDIPVTDFKFPADEALQKAELLWKRTVEVSGLPYYPMNSETEIRIVDVPGIRKVSTKDIQKSDLLLAPT